MARQSLRIARNDFEILKVCRELSVAFGSIRTESGTIKEVHAVLLQLDRPGMSGMEAYIYIDIGASMSNFKKWRVHHALVSGCEAQASRNCVTHESCSD